MNGLILPPSDDDDDDQSNSLKLTPPPCLFFGVFSRNWIDDDKVSDLKKDIKTSGGIVDSIVATIPSQPTTTTITTPLSTGWIAMCWAGLGNPL